MENATVSEDSNSSWYIGNSSIHGTMHDWLVTWNNSDFDVSADDVTDGYYDTSHYYYDDFYADYFFEIYPFEKYALGYVQPVLILLTMLTNLFVVGFFLTKKDSGKATDLLFVSIAFSDTMTGIMLLPNAFGVYAVEQVMLSRVWCESYMILRFYVSPVFHTVSVWQTVLLCIQRYMCVCHPFISGRICTFWKTFVSIIVMYILAAVMHVYHLVNNKLGHLRCRWKTETPCKETCIYLWFCAILEHFLPCILLVVLTIITIKELANAQKRVVAAMTYGRSLKRSTQDRIITHTAALIVLFFLIPELPHGIYRIVFLAFKHEGVYDGISTQQNHIIICVYELLLTISFCANFWIYCLMMHDFRNTVFQLFQCRANAFKRSLSHTRSFPLKSESSVRKPMLSCSSSIASKNRVFSRTTPLSSTASENNYAIASNISPSATGAPPTPMPSDDIYHNKQKNVLLTEGDENDDVFV